MADIEADISDALFTGVSAAVAASSKPTLPIKFPLRTFTIPADDNWLEIVQIRNNRSGTTWGTERDYQGILRLLLHCQNNDAGVIAPQAYLSSLASAFAKGKRFYSGAASVLIYDNPDMGSVIEDAQTIILPLTVLYRDFNA